jgi:hypothetical protein
MWRRREDAVGVRVEDGVDQKLVARKICRFLAAWSWESTSPNMGWDGKKSRGNALPAMPALAEADRCITFTSTLHLCQCTVRYLASPLVFGDIASASQRPIA